MKNLLLSLVIFLPIQAIAADDSVYTWGAWSQAIKPAAGIAHAAIPAPIQTPDTSFRPNEHSIFYRTASDTERQVATMSAQALRSLNQAGVSVGAPTATTGPATGGF